MKKPEGIRKNEWTARGGRSTRKKKKKRKTEEKIRTEAEQKKGSRSV